MRRTAPFFRSNSEAHSHTRTSEEGESTGKSGPLTFMKNSIDALAKGLAKPNRSPTKWVRFGEEEQRHERALIFDKKSEQAI